MQWVVLERLLYTRHYANELLQGFDGKVSHIELGSRSMKELLKGVLEDSTNTSQESLQ